VYQSTRFTFPKSNWSQNYFVNSLANKLKEKKTNYSHENVSSAHKIISVQEMNLYDQLIILPRSN